MLLKRFLLIAVAVLIAAAAINYIGSKDKPYFVAIEDVNLSPIGSEGYALKGKIKCYNPSYFSVMLAHLKVSFTESGKQIAEIDNNINLRVKANESASHLFEVRFEKELLDSLSKTIICNGNFTSGGFNAFSIPITDTIKLP